MNFSGYLYPFFGSPTAVGLAKPSSITAFRTIAPSRRMGIWGLQEDSMLVASNLYLGVTIDVFYLRVVIPIAMRFSGLD